MIIRKRILDRFVLLNYPGALLVLSLVVQFCFLYGKMQLTGLLLSIFAITFVCLSLLAKSKYGLFRRIKIKYFFEFSILLLLITMIVLFTWESGKKVPGFYLYSIAALFWLVLKVVFYIYCFCVKVVSGKTLSLRSKNSANGIR
jgi:hypothetical protein